MKKNIKKIITIFVSITLICSTICPQTYAANIKKYGISYNDSNYKATFESGRKMKTYDENGKCIGVMHYTLGRLRFKEKNPDKSYQDTLVVRMVMDPKKAVQSGSSKKWGCSEYLKVSAILPTTSINEWSPMNEPSTSTWNIGFTVASDKTLSIGASTDVKFEQLDFEADVQVSNRIMNIIYDYKPSINLSWSASKNKYCRNSSVQYAMISYNAKKYSGIKFKFDANFTYANEKNCRPWNIIPKSQKGSKLYTWKM